ncbi:MAG: diaminopimelate decarboxylase, partial [Gammaproteobacteria bacterium]|nr:diaminopimelate decarboxylase [Gammaproteobacteria bacterium]
MTDESSAAWWQRKDLVIENNELVFAARRVGELAAQFDSPAFFYHAHRVTDKLKGLHAALDNAGFAGRFKIHYAMKANRFAPLLTHLKGAGLCGIDACSPAEVEHAISCGFEPADISFTATSLSQKDLLQLSRYKDVFINCDSLHTIRHIGELCPGRDIGIRVNPEVGIGYGENEKLRYSGAASTKFGIYREQFHDALALAKKYKLNIKKIHFHTGCGYLNQQLDSWSDVIEQCLWFIDQLESVTSVNVGGGLG